MITFSSLPSVHALSNPPDIKMRPKQSVHSVLSWSAEELAPSCGYLPMTWLHRGMQCLLLWLPRFCPTYCCNLHMSTNCIITNYLVNKTKTMIYDCKIYTRFMLSYFSSKWVLEITVNPLKQKKGKFKYSLPYFLTLSTVKVSFLVYKVLLSQPNVPRVLLWSLI